MKLRLPALNFRTNLLPLFLRTRRIPILPTMLLLSCLIAMTGRSFAAQLELDLLKDPGGLANAIHVWEFQADGSQVQQMTGGNTFSNATDGLTGSLEGATGFFTVEISSVDNFDEVNFTNTLSDISGDKWAYNSAEANYGTKTPTDPLIQIQPGEAMLMTFDLSNLTLPSGKQLYVNGFKVQNGFTNSPGGQRISYLENGATNAVQLTGDSGEQNALVGGDDVIQPVGQSVDTGDQIAIWAASNFGQKRFVGFRFSVRQTVVLNTDDSGPGSLRQVLIDATSGDTITFDSALSGSTILLTSGQILIDKNLDIDASAVAGGITIDGNGSVTSNRIFEITAGTTNVFDSLTLTNGLATGSFPADRGGAVYVNTGAHLTLHNSTLSGNTANFGGGIYNLNSTLTLTSSTLSGNTATSTGGGIYNFNGGSVTLTSSTLSGNSAATGGGIRNGIGSTLNSTNSIIAGNTASTDDNISGISILSDINNLTSGDPLLAPLGDYGGPTQSMPPLPGSPAINVGAATTLITDQRGAPRFDGLPDIGAVEAQATVLNTDDNGPGSLRNAVAYGGYTPITFTNTLSGDTIVLTNGQITVSQSLTIDASALAGGITINGNGLVTSNRIFEITTGTTNVFDSLTLINGLATADSPANRGGAIYVNPGAHLTLHNSTLSGNSASEGGGIYNSTGGTLTLHNSTLSGNTANGGGGIYNEDGGTLTLTSSTLSSNSANFGGGIFNDNSTLTLHNSTLSGNTAVALGGGIYNNGTLTLHNSTLSDNAADDGGGIYNNSGTLTLHNSTLSSNSASFDGGGIYNRTGGTLTLNSSTLSGNSASFGGGIRNAARSPLNSTNSIVADNMAATGTNVYGSINSDVNNLTSGDPLLAPLGDYGGPTQTMPPLPGSPAIDAGLTSATNSPTDQRGMARVQSGGYGAPVVDIGAVEWNGWLVGQDVSGVDTNALLPGSVYDSSTVFPGGFDPDAAGMIGLLTPAEQASLIAQGVDQGEANVTGNPETYGLYNESAFQALALDRPFLTYNAASNSFTLTIGILETPDLVSTPFTNLTGFTTIPYPGDGEIDIEFTPPNSNARFYEIYGTEPPAP